MNHIHSLCHTGITYILDKMAIIVLATLLAGQSYGYHPDDNDRSEQDLDCFVFLVTGKPTAGTPKEEIQQMQTAHLQNFERLAKINKLSAAGPCSDPEKKIRGIVVVHAPSLEKAESLFETDPYINQGFMKSEIQPYKSIAGRFVVPENEQSLDKYTLVILSHNEEETLDLIQFQKVVDSFEDFAKKHFEAGNLGFAGIFEQPANVPSKRLGVMIFRRGDIDLVKEQLKEFEPAISNELRWQVIQQYMVKDAMPSHTESKK